MVSITHPRGGVHDHTGKDIRRSNETLRRTNSKAHPLSQDDGEEIRDGIGDRRQAEEDHGKAPDFQIEAGLEEFLQGEGFRVAVVAVGVDAADDKVAFALVEEAPGLGGTVGEVDEQDEAEEADCAGDLSSELLISSLWCWRYVPPLPK